MTNDIITAQQLNNTQLQTSAQALILFSKLPFSKENDGAKTGMVFAMEALAAELGLFDAFDGDITDPNYNTAQMMDEFANALQDYATQNQLVGWSDIATALPYGTQVYSMPADAPITPRNITANTEKVQVSDLSEQVLTNAAKSLMVFYSYTFFGERNITPKDGVFFAMCVQAARLGLFGDASLERREVDEIINQFLIGMTTCMPSNKSSGWAWSVIADEFNCSDPTNSEAPSTKSL